jgi:hypothetical protein
MDANQTKLNYLFPSIRKKSKTKEEEKLGSVGSGVSSIPYTKLA